MMLRLLVASSLLLARIAPGFAQEPRPVDLEEIEKEIARAADKPYAIGGFAEFQPTLFGIDQDSAITRARLYRDPPGSLFDQYAFRLRLEGSYKKGMFSAFIRSDNLVRKDLQGWDEDTRLFEAFASLKPSPNVIFEGGKRVMKWGKGYAWNPVSFIDRPKNPEDPEEALEGSTLFTTDFIRSFDGPLKTFTFTGAVVPAYEHVNAKFGNLNRTNFASKLYFLFYDTDIDLMVLTGESRTTRWGFDFAKNITSNFAIHGEFATINNSKKTYLDSKGVSIKTQSDALSYLLGIRYLSEKETTYILEYYGNGTGFTRKQMKDFFGFVDRSYDTFVATGNDSGLVRAANLVDGAYGMPNPGRHYLYLRASQKEPFDILYLTPAVTSIVNLADGSLALIPEISYSPLTNVELRFRVPLQLGRSGTEYGEKQNDYRIELRLRYHFQF